MIMALARIQGETAEIRDAVGNGKAV